MIDLTDIVLAIDAECGQEWSSRAVLYLVADDGARTEVRLPGRPADVLPGLFLPEQVTRAALVDQGWGFVDRESDEGTIVPDLVEVRVVTAMERNGPGAMLEHCREGTIDLTPPDQPGATIEGLVPATLRLVLGERGGEPKWGPQVVIGVLWLAELVRCAERAGSSDAVARLIDAGPGALAHSWLDASTARLLDGQDVLWDELRLEWARNARCAGEVRIARRAEWADAGWFAHELLDAYQPIEELLARLEAHGGTEGLERFRATLADRQLPSL